MPAKPVPPKRIPTYIVDGIDRQDHETLEAIEQYARERRGHLDALEDQNLDEEELADADEELVDVDESDQEDGAVVIKKVPCGKNCSGCPHGPYKYVVSRDGDSIDWDYRGRALEQE